MGIKSHFAKKFPCRVGVPKMTHHVTEFMVNCSVFYQKVDIRRVLSHNVRFYVKFHRFTIYNGGLIKAVRLSEIYITIENESIAMAIWFAMATVS